MQLELAKTLQSGYDEFYSDELTEWRELGGKYKALNIREVCAGHAFTKVLECGAGEGSILKHLDAAGVFPELYAIEISDSGISMLERRKLASLKEIKKFDGYQVPYPDKFFQMSYCSHVIEHVEHPRVLLRELARVSDYQVFEIPLDYSVGVERKVGDLLAYGHVNVFTPSLFKFLLKSEGYEILSEHFGKTADEVVRHNWYKRLNRKKTLWSETKILLRPLRDSLRQIAIGRKRHQEFSFSTYTCLARSTGSLAIF